jgi:hypothetical protein
VRANLASLISGRHTVEGDWRPTPKSLLKDTLCLTPFPLYADDVLNIVGRVAERGQ